MDLKFCATPIADISSMYPTSITAKGTYINLCKADEEFGINYPTVCPEWK